MSRLASFRGPSTPTASPVRQTSAPPSPAKVTESTFHRKTRTLLQELRSIADTWEDLVLVDGCKAATTLVDTRTELDNTIALIPDRRPRTHLVSPNLVTMEKCISELDNILEKLHKQFRRMNSVVDSLEALVAEAHKAKGWKWVQEEPLWVTWSLEKFASSMREILVPYHRSLNIHIILVETLRSHSVSFEDSRNAIAEWIAQPWLEEESWSAKWDDICSAEVERWNTQR
ncbi:hypothetical protein C8J56DRAFT_792229 [Mycena floridula]|nr:hypothetical protein C8J56DRAFT_792229 [Mycena floridula]